MRPIDADALIRYGEYRADFDDYECRYSGCGLVYNADDFCSYGERAKDE